MKWPETHVSEVKAAQMDTAFRRKNWAPKAIGLSVGLGGVLLMLFICWHGSTIRLTFGSSSEPSMDTGLIPKEDVEPISISKDFNNKIYAAGQRQALEILDIAVRENPWYNNIEVEFPHSGTHFLKYSRWSHTLYYTVEEIKPEVWLTCNGVSPSRIQQIVEQNGTLQSFQN